MPNHKTGILLVNLGTPDSPKPKDVFRYLIEFLTDGRVIDLPWLKRQLLVRGIIVPFRYKNSAKSYQAIWTEKGSPLMVHGIKVQNDLQKALGSEYIVELAMRYQNPSIESALLRLQDANVSKIVVLPLFPHYASATTGSVHQEVMRVLSQWTVIPELHLINSFPTNPKVIAAFADRAQGFNLDDYDHILMSFHGLPERHLQKADRHNHCLKTKECCRTLSLKNRDCYSAQSYATAQAIARKLGIQESKYSVCYQSRLGSDPWIGPFTSEVLKELRKKGAKRVLVFCPAFVADCLETIYEISVEYNHEFQALGGECVDLVPSLNDHPLWIEALKEMAINFEEVPLPQTHLTSEGSYQN